MRVKCLFLLTTTLLLMQIASAQQVLTIHGVTARKETTDRVAQVLIKNLHSGDLMMSDELGAFTIKAEVGDTLLFKKDEYTDQKIAVLNGSDLPVYMQPVIHLNTVTVQGQSTKKELNDVMAGYKKDGIFNNGKSLPVFQFITSPLTGFYNLIGTDPARARRFAAYSKNEQEAAAIDRRYNVAFIKRVTAASDTEATRFMQYYTPSYDDIKVWNDYDLAREVKKRYDYYEANKARITHKDLKMPPLPALPPTPKAEADN
ncbi:MAG TPA: hypothetical protein VFE53_25840 [Mucilaginibacter sp.]|nr:hypothetical protein [Mucilaginibacter sp.]